MHSTKLMNKHVDLANSRTFARQLSVTKTNVLD